jgi:hypothetical protein
VIRSIHRNKPWDQFVRSYVWDHAKHAIGVSWW